MHSQQSLVNGKHNSKKENSSLAKPGSGILSVLQSKLNFISHKESGRIRTRVGTLLSGKKERAELNKELGEEAERFEYFLFLLVPNLLFLGGGQTVPMNEDVLLPQCAPAFGTTGSQRKRKEDCRLRTVNCLQEQPTLPCLQLTALCLMEFISCHIYTRYCFLLMAHLLQI